MQQLITIEQTWHDFDRIIFIDNSHRGSVSLELYREPQEDGCTAFIYGLFVNDGERKRGLATSLLKSAEDEARKRGHKSVVLTWALKDSPQWVLEWYLRNGYKEKSFDGRGTFSVLEKHFD